MNDPQAKPFDFVSRSDPAALLDILQREQPYVIALVLVHLDPPMAAVILQNLPNVIQSEVTHLMAVMDRMSLEVVRGIEKMIEKKLSACDSYSAAGGIEYTVEVLNLLDRASEKQIIKALEDDDPELADEIKKRLFTFKDIILLDDRTVQRILREVDSQKLAKALKAADTEMKNKIFENMSKNAAKMVNEDMEYMGPVRLSDAEEAQQYIISIIRRLEDTGEIIIRAGEELV